MARYGGTCLLYVSTSPGRGFHRDDIDRRDSAPSVLATTATPRLTTAVSSVPVAPSVLGSRTLC